MYTNPRNRWLLRCFLALAAMILTTTMFASAALAQAKKKRDVQEMKLKTQDGLEMSAVYYASKKGKEAVPVLLLHDWGRSGADFKGLAEALQDAGHAVLVPDLRGHGGSTTYRDSTKPLDHKRLPNTAYHMMYARGGDVEACKSFLIRENNAEKLNIEKLCVVGAGLGAAVGLNWSLVDWAWPRVGGLKQGQDVKALVLLSPPWTTKTVSIGKILRAKLIAEQLTLYILVGDQGRDEYSDAKRIHKRLEAARGGTESETNLHYKALETKRQGAELLVPENLQVADRIKGFIEQKLVKETVPWAERKNPLASD